MDKIYTKGNLEHAKELLAQEPVNRCLFRSTFSKRARDGGVVLILVIKTGANDYLEVPIVYTGTNGGEWYIGLIEGDQVVKDPYYEGRIVVYSRLGAPAVGYKHPEMQRIAEYLATNDLHGILSAIWKKNHRA